MELRENINYAIIVIETIMIAFLALVILMQYQDIHREKEVYAFANVNPFVHSKLSFDTVQNDNKLWGYKIFVNDQFYLEHTHFPGYEDGLPAQAMAENIAILFITKMRTFSLPLLITKEDTMIIEDTLKAE